jgi:hypothetical protein
MLLPVHQVGLSFTTIPGHSICTSTSQTIQTSTSTAILGRSADLPLLGFMKRFMPTEALSFCLPLLLIFLSHSPTSWPTGLHKCAILGGVVSSQLSSLLIILHVSGYAAATFLIPESFSRSHWCRLQSSMISFRTHFQSAVRRGSSKRRSQDGLIRPVTECTVGSAGISSISSISSSSKCAGWLGIINYVRIIGLL